MVQNKPEKEKCNFVTEPGMISFPVLFPGQAEDSQKAGSKAYKCEFVTDNPGQELVNAISHVAQFYDSSAINPHTGAPYWHRHVYGPMGRLKRLEEYPRRKPETYPYAVGKFVIGVSKVVSLKGLKMEGANLADPTVRAEYDRRVASSAPQVVKFMSAHDPADLQWIAEENQRRAFANMPPIHESQIAQTTRPCRPDEIWAGCKVRISGRAYWDDNVHKTVLLALEKVLLVSHGERLVGGEIPPDQVFGAFAPAADLAPPSPWGQPAPQPPAPPAPWGQQPPPPPADPWAACR